MEQIQFSPFLTISTTRNPNVIYKTNIKRLKSTEEKADWQGTLRPEEQHGDRFLWVFLLLIYLRHGDEEASNSEIPMGTDQNATIKACCFYPKDQGRNNLASQKILDNNHSTSAKQCRKK